MTDENEVAASAPKRPPRKRANPAASATRTSPVSLASIPNLVALLWAVALGFSLCRQLGFYLFTDPALMSFMTLQDIVGNSLHYLPLSVLSVLANLAFRAYEVSGPSNKLAIGISNLVFRPQPKWGVVAYICFSLFIIVTTTWWPSQLMIVAVFLFGDVVEWCRKRGLIKRVPYFVVLLIFGLLGTHLFLQGASEALNLAERKPDYMIVMADTEAAEPVVFLRSTQDFVLVRMEGGVLANLPKSEITMMRQIYPRVHEAWVKLPDPKLGELWQWTTSWLNSAAPQAAT